MAPRAELLLAPATPAESWPSLVAALWPRAPERPTFLVAPLTGHALLLGRFQSVDAAVRERRDGPLETPVERRATGGRLLHVRDGCFGIALGMPDSGALLPGGEPVAPSKIVNRCVRPVLGALATLGVSAGYFGRDFISVGSRPVAYVSWDAQPGGAALFECLLGYEQPLALDAPWAALREVVPDRVQRAPDAPGFIASLRRGLAERLGAELAEPQPAPTPAGHAWPSPLEELPERRSSLHEIAIGAVEARVALGRAQSGPQLIESARILGDFQCDAASLQRLEQSLSGCPATFEEVGRRVDAAFGPRGHGTIVGFKSLSPIAQAVIEAAQSTARR
jgi:hypothetical protein